MTKSNFSWEEKVYRDRRLISLLTLGLCGVLVVELESLVRRNGNTKRTEIPTNMFTTGVPVVRLQIVWRSQLRLKFWRNKLMISFLDFKSLQSSMSGLLRSLNYFMKEKREIVTLCWLVTGSIMRNVWQNWISLRKCLL